MAPSAGQVGERGYLATVDGGETLPVLGLLPGIWGEGLDWWSILDGCPPRRLFVEHG